MQRQGGLKIAETTDWWKNNTQKMASVQQFCEYDNEGQVQANGSNQATVTQITTLYNSYVQKSIFECFFTQFLQFYSVRIGFLIIWRVKSRSRIIFNNDKIYCGSETFVPFMCAIEAIILHLKLISVPMICLTYNTITAVYRNHNITI